MSVDWGLVNKPAADWARKHAGESFTKDPEELRYIQKTIPRFFEEQWTQGRLWEELSHPKGPFSADRAEVIGRTETTRAASEGEQATGRQMAAQGMPMQPIWLTRNDELCCDICGPRNQKKIGVDFEEVYPPAHEGCRCSVAHEFKDD